MTLWTDDLTVTKQLKGKVLFEEFPLISAEETIILDYDDSATLSEIINPGH